MPTKIEYVTDTWNPVTGCTPVSSGCKNCYARRMAKRLAGRCGYPADEPFKVTLHPDRLEQPLKWKKPRRIFVCSMGDLFHPDVPADYITAIYDVMGAASKHTFIVLTKRPERIDPVLYGEDGRWHYGGGDYLPNVWHLTTAENQEMADKRIPILLKLREASSGWPVLGVSVEPMLGPISFRWAKWEPWKPLRNNHLDGLRRLNWIICGGESGPGARPMPPEWPRELKDQCREAGVPFFFKSWGEWVSPSQGDGIGITDNPRKVGKKRAGRLLDGREWNEYPKV